MRILVLVHEYPPVGGGGGRVAQDLCRGLAEQGHQLYVLTAHHGDLPLEEQETGIHIRRVVSGRRWAFRADLRAMLGYVLVSFWHGLGIVHHWKPDVIHAHFAVPAGAVALALSMFTGVPYILTAHLGDVPGGVPEKTGRWFRWIFPFTPPIWKRAKRVIAVSQFTRQLAQACYPVPIEVIPNGVDLQVFDPGDFRLQDPPRIIFAARFMAQKNPLQVVETLAELTELPWQCEMIGDGPLKEEVEQRVQVLGLQDRIRLHGWVTPDEVLQWYRQSDILFMPSLSEGLPVAGVQALAMGLALVVSRIGGWVDCVQEGENGFMMNPQDRAGFAAALRTLLNNPQYLLAARRASRALAMRFDLKRVVAAYAAIFSSVSKKT
jgi:glycosyltransferase involved in cell wall biosynthesis